jgi:hypothetical protein
MLDCLPVGLDVPGFNGADVVLALAAFDAAERGA